MLPPPPRSTLFPYTTFFRSHAADRIGRDPETIRRWIRAGKLPARIQRRNVSDRKSTRLNSSHTVISYAVFCLKKKTRCTPAGATAELYTVSKLPCPLVLFFT